MEVRLPAAGYSKLDHLQAVAAARYERWKQDSPIGWLIGVERLERLDRLVALVERREHPALACPERGVSILNFLSRTGVR